MQKKRIVYRQSNEAESSGKTRALCIESCSVFKQRMTMLFIFLLATPVLAEPGARRVLDPTAVFDVFTTQQSSHQAGAASSSAARTDDNEYKQVTVHELYRNEVQHRLPLRTIW